VRKGPKSVRVLVAAMPRILVDIIKGIVTSQHDFALVGEVSSEDELLQAAIDRRADVIIIGALAKTKSSDLHSLLYRRPRMKLIAIADGGRTAVLYELQPHIIPLEEISSTTLIAAIRSTPDSGGAPAFERL